jgi:Fe-S cluster assembly protein SufD
MKQTLKQSFKITLPELAGNDLRWLTDYRAQSFENFIQQGFPTRREENWKYTDLSFLDKAEFCSTQTTQLQSLPACFQSAEKNTHRLVFVDGQLSTELSSIDELTTQCTILSLQQAFNQQPELIKQYLEKIETKDVRLLNLNNAFMSDGYYISIPKNITIEPPLHLLFISSDKDNAMSFSRNIIKLEDNSALTIFEEHINLDGQSTFSNHLTQCVLEKNAQLELYKLQSQNADAIHIAHTQVDQQGDSQFNSYNVTLGSKLSRDDLNTKLKGQGAACQLYGLYVGEGKQLQDHHTRIDHLVPHGNSAEYYKGVLTGQAKGVFNGKVIVHPDAQKTNSQQTNKNLLLSKTAEANAKPELEIYADDVLCAHGATIGQIDQESLFYLRSRGLDRQSAIALLVHSFADEVLEKFKHGEIAEYMRRAVQAKMTEEFISLS